MKKLILFCLLPLNLFAATIQLTNNNGSVFFFNSDLPQINPSTSGGDMISATNIIHSTNILVTGDRTITPLEAVQSASAYFTFLVDTSPSNIALTFPEDFNFKIIVLNIGSNWVNYVAPSDRRFALAPFGGGISYSTNLFNKYALKAHTVKQYGTNFYVVDDFAPLPNFVYNVTNNLPLLAALAAGDGSALSGVSATVPGSVTNRVVFTNDNTWFDAKGLALAATNGLASGAFATAKATNGFITVADFPASLTNGFVKTGQSWPQSSITNATVYDTLGAAQAATNGLASGAFSAAKGTNGFITVADFPTSLTNQFMPKAVSGTTAFHSGNNPNGVEIAITNADSSSWSGFTAQGDTGSFVTNYFGMFINNSAFVPGSTYAGTTNDAVLEMAAGNFIVDMIGGNAHWFFITRTATNGTMTTNWDLTASALNFKTQPQFNGANLLTTIAVGVTNQYASTNDSQWFDRASDRVTLTNGYIRSVAITDTNTYTATNDARSLSLRASANLFNGAFAGMGSGLTNLNWGSVTSAPAFLTTIAVGVTNQFTPTNSGSASLTLGGLVRATNGFSSTISNSFPVTTFAITASITNFFTNTFTRSIVVGFTATTITGVGMTGTNAGVGGAFTQWATPLTGGMIPLRPGHTISFTNGVSAGTATWTPFP